MTIRALAATVLTLLTVLAATTAHADGLAVTANPVGMPLGLGLDVTKRLSTRFSVRAGAGVPAEPTAKKVKFGEVSYDVTLKLGGWNVFADWYPFAGNFHVSAGVTSVRDPWKLDARDAPTYVINGVSYPAEGVGALTGELRVTNHVGPAFLLGWGNPVRAGRRVGVSIDVGFCYVGNEEYSLHATGSLASDPAFRRDLAAEQKARSTEDAFWPILKFGISYQF